MKLTIKPEIVGNRYSVVIRFKEYGSTRLTKDMEEKLVDDYAPKFKLSDLTFEGKYTHNAVTGKISKDDDDGEEVKLTTPNREILISPDLELGYTIHSKEIADDEVGTFLADKDIVAQAKVQLFVDVVTEKIDNMLLALGKKLNDFEEVTEIEVG